MLTIYLSKVDFDAVMYQLTAVGWSLGCILIATLTAYMFATKAWQISINDASTRSLGLGKLFVIRQIGEALTIVNPTNIVAGELSKIYMLEKEGVSKHDGGVSIMVSRGLIILSYMLILVCSITYYAWQIVGADYISWIALLLVLTLLLFGFIFYALTSGDLVFYKLGSSIISTLSLEKKLNKTLRGLKDLNASMHLFYKNRRAAFGMVFLLSLIHWLSGTLEFYFILNALDFHISFIEALMIEMGVMVFKSLGGFVPGQIGVEEYGNKVMLGMIGITEFDVWIAVSLLRRARQLFWIGVGLIFLFCCYNRRSWKFSL